MTNVIHQFGGLELKHCQGMLERAPRVSAASLSGVTLVTELSAVLNASILELDFGLESWFKLYGPKQVH